MSYQGKLCEGGGGGVSIIKRGDDDKNGFESSRRIPDQVSSGEVYGT